MELEPSEPLLEAFEEEAGNEEEDEEVIEEDMVGRWFHHGAHHVTVM